MDDEQNILEDDEEEKEKIDDISLGNLNNNMDNDYKLAIDYYSKDNPFKKVIIGASAAAGGSFSATIIALGVSQAFIYGGVLYFDTAFLVGGVSIYAGIASVALAIPAIIGGIGYAIYKFKKSKDLKKFNAKLQDKENKSMKEEREIFQLLMKEIKDYFVGCIKYAFRSLKEQVTEYTKNNLEIIKTIRAKNKKKKLEENYNILKNELNNMEYLNIILIGSTGVGKSTLINGFLKLKKNVAEEGNTAKPQKIPEGWPKKYPIDPNDAEVKRIRLYDTEGIEKFSQENEFSTHLKKVIDFLESPETKLNEKINAIWYCISGNRLDGDEHYIEQILKLYHQSSIKIPIIFVYTKAYSGKEDDIDCIFSGLKEFKYFQENPKEFHFVEVIAKDKYNNRLKKITDKEKGLKELFNETVKLSKQSILAPIYQQISKYFNKKANDKVKAFSDCLQNQYDEIVVKNDKFKTFKDKLYKIFEVVYDEMKDLTWDEIEKMKENFEKIVDLMEKVKSNELKKGIKNMDKHYLINRIENDLRKKYGEKEDKNLNKDEDGKTITYDKFKTNIKDFMITQMNSSKDIYGLYYLYDLFRETILEEIINDLEFNLNEEKYEMTKHLKKEINQKINEFKKAFK